MSHNLNPIKDLTEDQAADATLEKLIARQLCLAADMNQPAMRRAAERFRQRLNLPAVAPRRRKASRRQPVTPAA